jgi:GcrA cell cycle regulator
MNDQLWADEMVARLEAMWRDGATATTIAAEFGISRNAVCGKVHRLKLPARAKRVRDPEILQRRVEVRKAQSAKRERERNRGPRGATAKPARPVEPPPYLGMALIPFADLRNFSGADGNQCRFIEGKEHPWLACGNETLPGASYCGHHHGIVYHKRGTEPQLSDEERNRRRAQAFRNCRQTITPSALRAEA